MVSEVESRAVYVSSFIVSKSKLLLQLGYKFLIVIKL